MLRETALVTFVAGIALVGITNLIVLYFLKIEKVSIGDLAIINGGFILGSLIVALVTLLL